MSRIIFLLTLICSLHCCALKPSSEVEMHGDVSFTPQERKDIEEAAFQWSLQTGGLVHIRIIWDLDFDSIEILKRHLPDHKIVKVPSDADSVSSIDCEASVQAGLPCDGTPRVLAWVWPSGGVHAKGSPPVRMTLIGDRLKSSSFRKGVALHEFGHVLGLQHVGDKRGIMYPSYSPKPFCLTKADMDEFCRVNDGCGTVEMFVCR